MDGLGDDHTKRRKSERERQIPNDITYVWIPTYNTNEPNYETEQTHGRSDVESCRRRGGREEMGWGFGVSRCKLLHIGWKHIKVPLYRTEKYLLSHDKS